MVSNARLLKGCREVSGSAMVRYEQVYRYANRCTGAGKRRPIRFVVPSNGAINRAMWPLCAVSGFSRAHWCSESRAGIRECDRHHGAPADAAGV